MKTEFANKEELFKYLRENKDVLLLEKKKQIKEADGFPTIFVVDDNGKSKATKTINETVADDMSKTIKADLIINTTNVVDSHMDLHVPGLWKKSLSEKKLLYLFQEHRYTFDKIISDDVKAYTEEYTFKELGADLDGSTQALVFSVEIDKERNPYMYGEYEKGHVKNHSVGMAYVKIYLAMNSESRWDEEEKEIWDKYYPMIANKELVDERGYFWAVTEAKIIEGSAVPMGSNSITPTMNITFTDDSNDAAGKSTVKENEPGSSTQDFSVELSKNEIAETIKNSLN